MNKFEQLTQYDFHDSLLEKISYDKDNNKIFLEIDFCNWKQSRYTKTEEETILISVVFENVLDVVIPTFKPNSDEIIKFELFSENGIRIVVFNDIDNSCYELIIFAETVKIIK